MSDTYDTAESRPSCEVVRLKVEGAGTAVNTLRDQQTARGMSLVCPFPALEVDIPVAFGSGDEMRRGAIHRIGVEDDPRTGLPRLRLSVRAYSLSGETRATVISPPAPSLLGEASRATRVPAELDRAATDLDVVTEGGDTDNLLDELLGGKRGRPTTGASFDGIDSAAAGPDPAWAALGQIPLPAELSPRSPTRRRKRLASAAAWVAILGLLAGGAYVLDRAGMASIREAREAALGFFRGAEDTPAPRLAAVPAVAEAEVEVAPPAEPVPVPSAELAETGDGETGYWDVPPLSSSVTEAAAAVEPAPVAVASAPAAEPVEAEPGELPAAAGPERPAATDDDLVLVLPTRWPAEYSTAYRLRDPNGVVVDVPGALVRKEGWLDIGEGHPMIRSVKAMQRESGARFVVYINGELPRFITAPKTGGIALRLFRDEADAPAATERVALAD